MYFISTDLAYIYVLLYKIVVPHALELNNTYSLHVQYNIEAGYSTHFKYHCSAVAVNQ